MIIRIRSTKGYIEIGYVFTYLISAMLLVSVIANTSNLAREATTSSIELLLQDIANRLACKLEQAVYLASVCKNASFDLSFHFSTELAGSPPVDIKYNIKISNTTVVITTLETSVEAHTYNLGIELKGDIAGYIMVRESASGSKDTIKISYEGGIISVFKAGA
ncbi:MAG: hypothetical protein QME47_01060 [Candidatus Thermoplasmatota archaeon]|nr:hypothetical protein [Candidatus Thermoplasmatota archaeon]